MHPIRHLIKLVELQDTSTGGLPPATLADEPGRRGPEGGEYWFRGGEKIAVPKQSDFGIQPMQQYRAFGFDPKDMLAWFETIDPHKAAYNEFQRHLADPEAMIFGSLGVRASSIAYALHQGWAYIAYNDRSASIWLDHSQARATVSSAGSLFPMMGMDSISLVLPRSNVGFENKVIRFYKEDHPGFAGAFGALIQWARDGTVPIQSWLYTVVEGDALQPDGIHAQPQAIVSQGNWTNKNVYSIPYFGRRTASFPRSSASSPTGTIYRFPSQVATELGLEQGDRVIDKAVLFSKQPFVIPADMLQRKTIAGWVPLNQ